MNADKNWAPQQEENKIVHSCKLANRGADVRKAEREFQEIGTAIEEPWGDALAR